MIKSVEINLIHFQFLFRGNLIFILINIFFSFTQELGSSTVFSNSSVADHGDVLILSVKPQVVHKVLPEIKSKNKLLLSIAMGISLNTLEKVN